MAPSLLGSVPSGANSHSNWVNSDGTLLISAQEISDGEVVGNGLYQSTVFMGAVGLEYSFGRRGQM